MMDRTSSIIITIVLDAAKGEPHALMGLVHFLIHCKGYNRKRLLRFACVTLKLPYWYAANTLSEVII